MLGELHLIGVDFPIMYCGLWLAKKAYGDSLRFFYSCTVIAE